LEQRKHRMMDDPVGKWQCFDRDLAKEVSDKLERAFLAGELRIGVWDNGLFRDFDLAKMQEIPGLRQLKRVKKPVERPATCPASPTRQNRF